MNFLDVAVPVPLRQTFTYHFERDVRPGCRVRVPFGNRKLIGVVVGKCEPPEQTDKIKAIENVIDEMPVFDDTQLQLCRWLSQYYHHSLGEVLTTALPVLLRKGESASAPEQSWVRVTCAGETTDLASLKAAKKQQTCLETLLSEEMLLDDLKQEFSAAVINGLVEKGLAEIYDAALPLNPRAWLDHMAVSDKPRPDPEQAVAITTINQQSHAFTPVLLEGVTGSGKTEVYLQALEGILKAGKQALILVPEIGLTPQTVRRFEQRFGIRVGVLHSQLTDKARLAVWLQAKSGELGIVIGTRSAIFTPLKFPGILIVDEEHDESFKQQDGLRYHARDLAVMRARLENIPLVLGTATPSLESLNNALSKRYHHLQLTRRAGGAASTHQHVLDIRDQLLHFGIAEGMLNVMRQHIQHGNQVLVFVNRRGYAPALLCHHCGHTTTCKRCDQPYTVHRQPKRLQCHHCSATRAMPQQCEQCGSQELVTAGVGTEQLEQGLAQLFPGVAQVRIDSDSVRGKDKLHSTLDAINKRQYQLLVGTQILSKGHHFPHVTLVVVLDCDGALFSADFRAPEKLAQLVTQLAGRAGRASKPGEMWLQTHNPDHPLLQDLVHNGYGHFARHALLERKMSGLPPYSSQIILRAEAQDAERAYDFLQQARQQLAQYADVQLLGPVPCLIEKRQGRYRFMLVAQSLARKPLHEALRKSLPFINALPLSAKVRWSVDIDPTDLS